MACVLEVSGMWAYSYRLTQALFDRVADFSNMHVVLNSLDDPIGKEAIDVFNVELLRERNRCIPNSGWTFVVGRCSDGDADVPM